MCTHFSWAWFLPFPDCIVTLFRHCLNKLEGHLSMSIQKIVTENFRWGLKWERITPNFPNHEKAMTGWYDFSNINSSKMLSFKSVAEANGLIYPLPSGGNFSFALLRNHMKHSFHVFHYGLKTFERDKHLGFALTFISFSCFHEHLFHETASSILFWNHKNNVTRIFLSPDESVDLTEVLSCRATLFERSRYNLVSLW